LEFLKQNYGININGLSPLPTDNHGLDIQKIFATIRYGIMDENGDMLCDDFLVPPETNFELSLSQTVISCSTALLSRNIVDRYRFATDFYHEDLALWLQLLKDGYRACGVTEVLAQYRVMQGTRASNKLKSAINRWRIYRKYLNLPFLRSVSYLTKYAFLGLKKYRIR